MQKRDGMMEVVGGSMAVAEKLSGLLAIKINKNYLEQTLELGFRVSHVKALVNQSHCCRM